MIEKWDPQKEYSPNELVEFMGIIFKSSTTNKSVVPLRATDVGNSLNYINNLSDVMELVDSYGCSYNNLAGINYTWIRLT